MSFLTEFFDLTEGTGEQAVLCPFDHFTANGTPYKESHPSAHVNTDTMLFHCKACNKGYNEVQFIQQLFGCNFITARKIQAIFKNDETELEWNNEALSEATLAKAMELGISVDVINELNIKTPPNPREDGVLAFPVFMYGHLMDVRKYQPNGNPKIRSRKDAICGLIIPYDLWVETPENRKTIICAGEKDMAIARSKGFNAITLTGGENSLCRIPKVFENRSIAICYDNDSAGIQGAKALANQLSEYTNDIKVVTSFHEICSNEGEDITDFFMKYNMTAKDLVEYIEATPRFIPEPTVTKKKHKQMTLLEASKPEHLGEIVESNIQVVAMYDTTFAAPAAAVAVKQELSGLKDTMEVGESKDWILHDDNAEELMYLIDGKIDETTMKKNLKRLMHIPISERCVSVTISEKKTIFKCVVTDLFETATIDEQPMEFTAYSIGTRLESGKKYKITYKIVPHPLKGQQLVMLILDTSTASDSVSNFTLSKFNIDCLKKIQEIPGTVEEKINIMTEKVKGLLGYNGNNTLIQAIDFCFNTVLMFNFGTFKNVRGYLDTIIVGESRVGKSSTAEALRRTYQLGVFTSLAGNSATIAGLIGGSNKISTGNFQTRAGIIPQNHKGMVIFEEFGKCSADIISELTDIRSSNEVRITRVGGTLVLPAYVRMLALTNVKHTDVIKPISSYPNGISIISELVKTAEDIARYDMIVILADRGNSQIDPLWEPEKPFADEVYQARIRWIWSRTPDQIIISRDLAKYIVEKSNELNKEFDCHIKIFGTEAWKKITRLAIAVAGYVVSTDDSYESIIVKKEHVDYAIKFLRNLYDNETFRLKEYAKNEREYDTVSQESLNVLQTVFEKCPALVLQLEQVTEISQVALKSCVGIDTNDLGKLLNILIRYKLVQVKQNNIIPTGRFRKEVLQINRNTRVERIGV